MASNLSAPLPHYLRRHCYRVTVNERRLSLKRPARRDVARVDRKQRSRRGLRPATDTSQCAVPGGAAGSEVMIDVNGPWWRGMMRTIKTGGLAVLAVGILLAGTSLSLAQTQQVFPGGKAIEMTVMFGAGSAADVTARYLADGMAKRLNVPVPVVNRTGGGGAIGYSHVKKQRADGYSIIWNSNSISTTYYSGTLPFDYRAFDAVARVSVETPVIV